MNKLKKKDLNLQVFQMQKIPLSVLSKSKSNK